MASRTSFTAGRELALQLHPSSDLGEVRERARVTTEARRLLEIRPNLGLGGARDIRALVQRARIGGRLEPSELLDVQSTLQSGRGLRVNILRLADQLPTLADIAAQVADCAHVEAEIMRCVNERAEVVGEASAALGQIRAGLRSARERLLNRLSDVLASAGHRPMIQEPIITQRDGRYVIPVKAEFKGRFRGIIHDQSASGATLFIEPLATVELNNRVRELELAEEHEVDRILRALSSQVAASARELEGNVVALAMLDLALAKAKYAADLRAVEAEAAECGAIVDGAALSLLNARHPLLTGDVVPITVHIGGAVRALVVTGPNTGGKTVALKTVGLLTLMVQSGLHIPADEGSRVPVYEEVFADIGDEQSIEQSLSTFSSHMRNVVKVLRVADARSLVLFDELGAGTDPAEGSALAQAILDYLLRRGAMVMATTHYSELKAYAHNTPGVENASVEFDVETLTPTYRLTIGLPGRSNALAIATRLGLLTEVIEAAQSRLAPNEAAVEQMLAEIQEERDRAITERLEAEEALAAARKARARLEQRLSGIAQEREAIMAEAREQAGAAAGKEIALVGEQLREALQALKPATPDRQALLNGLREVQRAARALEERREEERPRQQPQTRPTTEGTGRLRVGDLVMVARLDQQGELVALSEGGADAEVQVGAFKLRVPIGDLRRLGRASHVMEAGQEAFFLSERPAVPLEIEVRGWRAEEVPPVVDKYVHDAYLAGLPFVRIIHGKGTGVLRRLVREQLSTNPLVRSLRHPEPRDGGEGVTVVELSS